MKIKSKVIPEVPRFVTQRQFAEIVSVKPASISNRIYRGKQKGVVKDGGRYLIDVDIALSS